MVVDIHVEYQLDDQVQAEPKKKRKKGWASACVVVFGGLRNVLKHKCTTDFIFQAKLLVQ